MSIPFPIPEPYRAKLIEAGIAACSHHFPRINKGKPSETFTATADYRADHQKVEDVITDIEAAFA